MQIERLKKIELLAFRDPLTSSSGNNKNLF